MGQHERVCRVMVDLGFCKHAKIKEKEKRNYIWHNAFRTAPSDSDIKWVLLINKSKEKEVTICNYNPNLHYWEVMEGEEVICWMNFEDFLPTPPNYGNFLIKRLSLENKKEILATIGKTINRYETRVRKNHWVNNSLWLHRSIVSNKYPEHSKESFEECIKFAKERNVSLTLEFDIMLYKGEVKCYHKDKISSILGQEVSCAEKLNIEGFKNFTVEQQISGCIISAENDFGHIIITQIKAK